MKQAVYIGIGLLLIGLASIACTSSPSQNEASPDTFETFAQWCQNRASLPSATQHTVEAILDVVGTQRCRRAEAKLTDSSKLDLSNRNIVDLSPLTSVAHLSSLNLSANE